MNGKNFFLIVFVVFVLDQISKYYVRMLELSGKYLHYTQNTGAAFGLFKGSNVFLAMLTLTVVFIILYLYFKEPHYFKEKWVNWSTALIVGGALGNFIDRFVFGFVIDFIDLQIWPVFNLADIALTAGVLILAFVCWKEK